MAIIVLDTDVASQIYKDGAAESMISQLDGHTLCLTFVTVGEMTRWAEKRNWGTRQRTDLVRWIGNLAVLRYDIHMAARWGRAMAASDRRGRTRPENDTWIAATCLEAGLPLATNNVKDFADLVDHEGLELITA
jgi:predicted nucleic acid-binding protein